MVQANSVNKSKIYVIGGPTAVGKSNFAIDCALEFNGEIISADSMQIYKGLNVGTGKVTMDETRGIKHHMLDILSPDQRYSVGQFMVDAKNCIEDVLSRNKLPIIVGGTGLYINALLNGMNLADAEKSDLIREKWKKIASESGNQYVYDYLLKIDPTSAEKISPNDIKRVIRAIEIFEVTGKPKSENAQTVECDYNYRFTILSDERELLYARINARVEKMFESGLEAEVKSLIDFADCQSMQAIGYKQFIEFFNGNADFNETKEKIKQASRNYAKRQLTFFKGMNATNKNWITPKDFEIEKQNLKKFIEN